MRSSASINTTLEAADRRGELISSLLSLEISVHRHDCGRILCDLHNSGAISLVSDENFAAIEGLSNGDFWSIRHFLDQAIPELDCSHRDVLRLVHILVSKAGTDGAASIPNSSLIQWCKANPDQAKLIVEDAKSLDAVSLSHCIYAIQGIGSLELAFDLLEHADRVVVAVGLRSLGVLNMSDEAHAKRVIDECCTAIASDNNLDVNSSAIETAFRAWEKLDPLVPYRQKEFLKAIVNVKKGEALVQLSASLFYHPKGLSSESVGTILEALTGEVSDPRVILYWLDSALYSKMESFDLIKVIDVYTKQISTLKGSIRPSDLPNFCQWIWKYPKNASRLFSRWLSDGQPSLCKFLADMVGEGGRKNHLVDIYDDNLPADLEDQIFMARKCVGFLWFHEVTAASILLSIVRNGKKSAREVSEELLYTPLLLSYSGDLRDFLEGQFENSSRRISRCSRRLIERQDAYFAGLRKVEKLVEFQPTIEQRRSAEMKERAQNKSIQKGAHEVLSLIHI